MATPALAAPGGDECVKQPDGTLKCKFGGDDVWGEILGPKGRWIDGRRGPVFPTLIEYRIDWELEFEKAAEEL